MKLLSIDVDVDDNRYILRNAAATVEQTIENVTCEFTVKSQKVVSGSDVLNRTIIVNSSLEDAGINLQKALKEALSDGV